MGWEMPGANVNSITSHLSALREPEKVGTVSSRGAQSFQATAIGAALKPTLDIACERNNVLFELDPFSKHVHCLLIPMQNRSIQHLLVSQSYGDKNII
jgi:hypothetical protein